MSEPVSTNQKSEKTAEKQGFCDFVVAFYHHLHHHLIGGYKLVLERLRIKK